MNENKVNVLWAGVVVKLSDGRTLALEFKEGFITADIHTVKPWNQLSRNKTQDEMRIVVQGNGQIWTEGENLGPNRTIVVTPQELESPGRRARPLELEG
jgi:hypothetical protein